MNYLYLSQKLAEIDDPVKREEFLKALAHGSAAPGGHPYLLGEYDFSEHKLKDSVGIKPPKLTEPPPCLSRSFKAKRLCEACERRLCCAFTSTQTSTTT